MTDVTALNRYLDRFHPRHSREHEDLLRAVLDEHAHNLADRIRSTDLPDDHIDMFTNGADWAADVIDPAVNR
jgi:hypothetical protein